MFGLKPRNVVIITRYYVDGGNQ